MSVREPPPDARTRTCEFWVEPGFLRARFLAGADVSGADAQENLATTARLSGGVRVPVVVDLRGLRSQSAEARAVLAGPEAARVSRAVALVIGSPLSRVLGNFYLRFNRPETPTRLFSSVAEACGWAVALGREAGDAAHGG